MGDAGAGQLWRPAIVATDLDGTIVRPDGAISARTRAALSLVEDAGSWLVLVTGRPQRWLAPIAEQTAHRGLAICSNGALFYDLHTETVLEAHLLTPKQLSDLCHTMRSELPELTFAVEYGDRFAHEPHYPVRFPGPDLRTVDLTELCALPAVKLLARHADMDPDTLLLRARSVAGHLGELTHSSRDGLLEISAPGVSKASGLARFCAERGVDAREVLAFGDMPNDLPMLTWAGRAYAMANAHPQVLQEVSRVAPSVYDDGVAVVLEELFSDRS
ncbi:MAG TPA: HAD family hydrolase [Actinomycetes bacterium]|nr:HAD family hydrolase [Actinomycetes bacterium]